MISQLGATSRPSLLNHENLVFPIVVRDLLELFRMSSDDQRYEQKLVPLGQLSHLKKRGYLHF
jgi:hypothetical protein